VAVARLLRHSVPHTARSIVVLGAGAGRSTKFLADFAPQATLVAIDHRHGKPEQLADSPPPIDRLHETLLAECWDLRERVIPLRMKSQAALRLLANERLEPDAIFVDGDRGPDEIIADVRTALDLFPKALVIGGNWRHEAVARGVEQTVRERGLQVDVLETAWRIVR